ncbi:MAG: choice-of-anchor D domain-containing protein, partial [Nevskiales bacterium]
AIDPVGGGSCLNSPELGLDQRGFLRDGNCDVGAYEVSNTQANYDFGDAPTADQSGFAADYPVTLAQDGARHVSNRSSQEPYLGATPGDADDDGQPDDDAGATGGGDDGDMMTGDDEDGLTIPSPIVAGQNLKDVFMVVTVGTPAVYSAWLDLNKDGVWDDSTEKLADDLTTQGVSPDDGNFPDDDSFTAPAAGDYFMRIRVCSQTGQCNTPTGLAADGEVEDHQITIAPPPVNGACGTASNMTPVAAKPVANLCAMGTATAVGGNDTHWTWGCNGIDGGASTAADACMAPYGTQTISNFASNPAALDGTGSTGTLSADSTGSGDPVLFTSRAAAVCSVANTTVTAITNGTCTVKANKPAVTTGDERYTAAAEASLDIAVNAPIFSADKMTLSFGSVAVGAASAEQTITVTNTGNANLVLSALTAAGNGADFRLTNPTCPSATVAPMATCTVTVSFEPKATGAREATASLTSNAAGSPHVFTFRGTGTGAAATSDDDDDDDDCSGADYLLLCAGSGGCSMRATGGPLDPTLPLLALLSLAYLLRTRRAE